VRLHKNKKLVYVTGENRVNSQSMDWKKIFARLFVHLTNTENMKGTQLYKKRLIIELRTSQRILIDISLKQIYKLEKICQKYSILQVTRKLQIKIIIRYHLIPTSMDII
jgi:hypothetical protein